MKSLLRKCAVAFALLAVVVLMAACIPTDEAKTQANELLLCLSNGDYEGAVSYVHPESPIDAEYMQKFTEESANLGADLSTGLYKIFYNSIESSYYHSSVDGKRLVLGGIVTLNDGTEFDISFVFIDNDSGYGISQFSASSFRK